MNRSLMFVFAFLWRQDRALTRKRLLGCCLLVMGCAVATPARSVRADLIQNVATGLDSNGNLILTSPTTGLGAADAHWTVDNPTYPPGPYSGPAHVVTPSNPDWYDGFAGGPALAANGPNSDWIAVNANTIHNGPAPYTFSTTFNLTGYDLSTVSISGGAWAAANGGSLYLNGNLLNSLGDFQWNALTAFSAPSSDFVQGVNTLSIILTISDNFYEEVRLEGTVTGSPFVSGVPEPASLTLLGIGSVGLLGFGWRRHRRGQRQAGRLEAVM